MAGDTLKISKKTKPIVEDLEIKDAQMIFNTIWTELEQEQGPENLRFPKEIILLGGAPGAGKGTHTRFVQKARGLTCDSIVVSSLLNSPESRRIKNSGGMVGDREVMGILFRKLLEKDYRDGAILDGFPRTKVQVECLKVLVDKMKELRARYYDTPLRVHFRQPTIHIMVLFVDEKTSVDRQIKRGKQIAEHNEEVKSTGVGEIIELRATDRDPEAASRRYGVFKEQTWDALQSLKQTFFYHFINAQGSIQEVEQNILNEVRYQSLLELDPETFDSLRILPLASEIILHARQDLVKRLDAYALEHPELFHQVIQFVQEKILPIVFRHAISGLATVNSEDKLLHDDLAMAILIDIFSERGFHAVVDLHRIEIPERVDLKTGLINCREKKVFRISIRFQGSEIRRG
ncbi:MAG: nucleoside monophosphate kinase [Verrucomicrobia bacterium]|nr:nucleoside monophosphate kinase [Verrucomicrobiota bacterium]MBT7535509.1 nucleoside monophosphate kinase [Verrucomicrobiota bacterium]